MKCLYCKFTVPNDANVCGHCGRDLTEQHRHRTKWFYSCLIVFVPVIAVAILIDIELTGLNMLLLNLFYWIPVFIVFKRFFKGEFKMTGIL